MSPRVNQTPFLLRIAMVLGAIFGVLGTLAGVVGLVSIALNDVVLQIDDTVLARAAFAKIAVPFLVLYVAACVTAGLAARAIWMRQARSRTLLAVLLAEFVIGDAAMLVVARRVFEAQLSEVALSAAVFAVLVGVGLWYLFRKESVVRYYASAG